jgi:hypothetical protein
MNLESLEIPKLTNYKPKQEIIKIKGKFNLNKILLISFILFTIFFLYNCKNGIFKGDESKIIPFNLYEKN